MLNCNLSMLFVLLLAVALFVSGCQMAPARDRVNPVASYVRTVE